LPLNSINISDQTLEDFLENPFHRKDFTKKTDYEDRYLKFSKTNKGIKFVNALEYEDNFFIHIQVPSESEIKKGDKSHIHITKYDVIIQFFTDKDLLKKRGDLRKYYVQFFSNSPGFVYRYASLYKLEGYLIESLYDKFPVGALNVLPDKANSKYELSYDSSIYYACRYMLDHRLLYFSKMYLRMWGTKDPNKFFSRVQDTEEVNISKDVVSLERRLKAEINNDLQATAVKEKKLRDNGGKLAKDLDQNRPSVIKGINKRKANSSTYKDKSNNSKVVKAGGRKNKVTAKKSTKK